MKDDVKKAIENMNLWLKWYPRDFANAVMFGTDSLDYNEESLNQFEDQLKKNFPKLFFQFNKLYQ